MRSALVLLVLIAGCGRIGFDAIGESGGDGGTDAPINARRWKQVALQRESGCGISIDGALWCWGNGYNGQTGMGSTLIMPPTRVGTATDWTTIATDGVHSCGTRADGSLWCWGTNNRNALGIGVIDQLYDQPTALAGTGWTTVDVGLENGCALRDDRTLWCWGRNTSGQLGLGSTTDEPRPRQVGTATWISFAMGSRHACGIQTDQTLWCWGDNAVGQLGDNTSTNRTSPVPVNPAMQWSSVVAGLEHTCANELDGTVWCWGRSNEGEVGDGTRTDRRVPTRTTGPALTRLATDYLHTCGLTASGEVWCWGDATTGRIPGVDARTATTPVHVKAPVASAVTLGALTSCILDADSHLWCAGSNATGQMGIVPPGELHAVEQADTRTDWTRIVASLSHACGTTADDTTWCWGEGGLGQLGDDQFNSRKVPIVTSTVAFTKLELGDYATYGLTAAGTALVTGNDKLTGSTYGTMTPTMNVSAVGASQNHTCRIAGGTLRCYGTNNEGQLGDGTTTDRPAGVDLAGTWLDVAAGANVTCGIRSDQQLACWGFPDFTGTGQALVTSPTLVPLAAPVTAIDFGLDSGCALRGTGELWCWGYNDRGQLGDGTEIDRTTPVRIGTRTDWRNVDLGDWHACAVTRENTLWCWGHEDQGQLGTDTQQVLSRRTPLQVGTDTDWKEVACGYHFTCALKLDGTRWCFGQNLTGELGNDRGWLTAFTVVP